MCVRFCDYNFFFLIISDKREKVAKMSTVAEINNNVDQQEQYLRSLTKTFTGIEKPLKHFKSVETLSELISELHKVFDSDRVNIEYVNHLLLSYKSNPSEWKKFAKFDRYR